LLPAVADGLRKWLTPEVTIAYCSPWCFLTYKASGDDSQICSDGLWEISATTPVSVARPWGRAWIGRTSPPSRSGYWHDWFGHIIYSKTIRTYLRIVVISDSSW